MKHISEVLTTAMEDLRVEEEQLTTRTPQRMTALAGANRTRVARAALKREVYAGKLDVDTLILDPPWCLETCAVGELLRAQRRWGNARVRRFLDALGVSERRRLGALTERQRQLLAREFNAYIANRPAFWARLRQAR